MSSKVLPPTPPTEPANPASTMDLHLPADHQAQHTKEKHIWILTGPAGCGKTSVAEHLHETFSLPYLEGDAYHTPTSVAKMAAGQPLTDADRWDWLVALREAALKALQTTNTSGVILTCSALKKKYRDVLRIAAYQQASIRVHFLYLSVSEAVLMERVRGRKGHYMKDYMVHSQVESLEVPGVEERDVLVVEAGGAQREVLSEAEGCVRGIMEGL